ncbi:MAG: putative nucleotidyltransferase component of viral defense system [Gammaproteobacteria bacterium]|jgi:predicted nucleotidyltransferase component of viral defense system
MSVHSIKARLLNYSRANRQIHQFTLIRYFQERFLYRLSISDYKNNLLLKGGALAYVFNKEDSRHTKDIDFLLVKLKSKGEDLKTVFAEICALDCADGVEFAGEIIEIEPIQKEGNYTGTRVKFLATLGNIQQSMQIDIGVGDYVTNGPIEIVYPIILEDLEKPILHAYSVETYIAEKFHAMVSLGEYNSRMKDFYDVFNAIEDCDLAVLKMAIHNTFERRETLYLKDAAIFSEDFYTDENRLKQWNKFLKKNNLTLVEYTEIYNCISTKLKAIYDEMEKD